MLNQFGLHGYKSLVYKRLKMFGTEEMRNTINGTGPILIIFFVFLFCIGYIHVTFDFRSALEKDMFRDWDSDH